MTVLISLLIGTAVLYILFLQISESNELTRTKFRFRYFALRDELAMLVAKGKLKEDSWEYQHIVETLNFHISAVERLSLFRIVDVLANYHLSSEEERQVITLSKKIEDREVTKIVVGYMKTTYDLIKRNSRVQLALVRLLGRQLQKSNTSKFQPGVIASTPDRALTTIRSHQDALEPRLLVA